MCHWIARVVAEDAHDEFLRLVSLWWMDLCATDSTSRGLDRQLTSQLKVVDPACSDDLQVVGRFASYRNIPILTGLGDVLKGREEFRTLIRMSYDLQDKAHAILAFLEHFNWKKFGMIYRQNDVYYTAMADLLFYLASTKILM
ncbi:hypothetical protein CEXT_168821 [Caerostris extrusa]|uniref:Receptor ligand binding region domain-containing protein n=1 Tax=Caerostris extrusa TaxID=172846 RepID=A0AAV4XHV0_CAEEX|nr:hypothetical protein CEXT_168821 [Caerostris extrusa]